MIPTEVTIGGVCFKVVLADCDGCGEFDATAETITISAGDSYGAQRKTLFHEALHAALYVSGQSERLSPKQEESLVVALEHSLWPLVNGGFGNAN